MPSIILYEYTRTRSGDHAKEFLAGFHGFHVSDAYDGYEKVEGIARRICYSHLRRYYLEAIPLDSGKKEIPGSGGAVGRAYCDKLFRLEPRDALAKEKLYTTLYEASLADDISMDSV